MFNNGVSKHFWCVHNNWVSISNDFYKISKLKGICRIHFTNLSNDSKVPNPALRRFFRNVGILPGNFCSIWQYLFQCMQYPVKSIVKQPTVVHKKGSFLVRRHSTPSSIRDTNLNSVYCHDVLICLSHVFSTNHKLVLSKYDLFHNASRGHR